ncbi:MAG: Sec-independent protein translocase protein TatB [Nitrospirae bacterium]|nr:Sec-independent protein translocase protein TatB [Nitrospirota bacterium]MCL5236445.1 Sec-independent protein translocase protein TatB [Nitrospirota bacterium]
MFDLGIQELIVIFVVALLVFGPKRLPELGRSLGKGIAELKRAMQGVREQMDAELHEIKQPVTQEPEKENKENENKGITTDNAYTHEPAKEEGNRDPGKDKS